MRAVFFGTPEIAVPALLALTEIATVSAVVCQPDRPAGRGLAAKPPPVKEAALALGIPVVQPTKVRVPEFAAWLRDQEADVAVVMAYGRILPLAVLQAPRLGCINLHASILPKYRGAAPITWALVDGETESGVSLMQMDEGMDTGPAFAIRRVAIGPDMNAAELSAALSACAAEMVTLDLPRALRKELLAEPQSGEGVSHARMLAKADGRVDFSRDAQAVHNHIRGMTPWPGAQTSVETRHGSKQLKLLKTSLVDEPSLGPPGAISVVGKRIFISCGDGALELLVGQVEGKKALAASDLVSGRVLADGMRLNIEDPGKAETAVDKPQRMP